MIYQSIYFFPNDSNLAFRDWVSPLLKVPYSDLLGTLVAAGAGRLTGADVVGLDGEEVAATGVAVFAEGRLVGALAAVDTDGGVPGF